MLRLSAILPAFCCVLASCNAPAVRPATASGAARPSDSIVRLIRTGDIVLSSGKDEISLFFARLNHTDRRFSHCGIAIVADSGVRIAHISAGSGASATDFHIEPLTAFVAAERNSGWRIVRPPLTDTDRKHLINTLQQYRARNIRFDSHFDLASDDELYCSELVYKALREAGVPDAVFHISRSGTGKAYVGVDDLYLNNRCTTICQIVY